MDVDARAGALQTDGGPCAALHDQLSSDSKWRERLILFIAGAVSVLAMAPFFLWPVMFVTLPVLVFSIDARIANAQVPLRARAWRAAGSGWWFGFGYFFAGLFWIGEAFLVEIETFGWLLPIAVTGMPAGLALFYALGTAAAAVFWRPGLTRLLVLAITMAAAEWLRGHVLTGFPWNTIGYALTAPLTMAQSAGLLGIYGLSAWAVLIFSAPISLACARDRSTSRWAGGLAGAAIAGCTLIVLGVYGSVRLTASAPADVAGVNVRLVQPAVAQREKWRPENRRAIFESYLDLSRRDAKGRMDNLAGITHVIWPESATPFLLLRTPEALKAIGELLPDGTSLMTGAIRFQDSDAGKKRLFFNSLLAFDSDGKLTSQYDKIHLVPFGEYLPVRPVLEAIGLRQLTQQRGGFESGPEPRPLIRIGHLPAFAALICYEAVFPGEIIPEGLRPGLLLNVTNDGWFGQTTGPHQHFHKARVRAIEQGLPLIRVANTGISAVIDGKGRVQAKLGLNERGVIDAAVPGAEPRTVYGRYGDWIFIANLVAFSLVAALFSNRTVLT